MDATENDIQSRLLSFYEKEYPTRENTRIFNLTRISDGWENDVYSFTMHYEGGARQTYEDRILRIYPGDDATKKSAHEFATMKRLHAVGYPVPEVLLLKSDSSHLGKPFVIMEKIDGRTLDDVTSESSEEKKGELLTLACKLFVELHTLDWRPFVADPLPYATEEPSDIMSDQLTQFQARVHNFQRAEFDPIFDWLEQRAKNIKYDRLSVIHGDYHPRNILVRNDGAPFVIDWGSSRVLDFRLDLALTTILISTHGHPEAREIFLNKYERIAERRIEGIEYFEVVACLVRLFNISVSLSDGASKLGMRPGAEALMKQNVGHIQNVYELLLNRTDIPIPEIERLVNEILS